MVKILGFVIGLVGVFWLAIAGYWWDAYRPTGWPSYHLNGPFGCCTLKLPDGYGARYRALLAEEQAQAIKTTKVKIAQAQITSQASSQEAVAQTQIRTITKTIVKEVPTYVTPAIDRSFPLSIGFVRVLDAGAAGVDVSKITSPASQPDDSASPTPSSIVAENTVDDFGICRANAERLAALQSWISSELKVSN